MEKSITKSLDIIMIKDVQKQLSWSGLRTNLPSFAKQYKAIVDAMNDALLQKYQDYNFDVLETKLKALLGKKN